MKKGWVSRYLDTYLNVYEMLKNIPIFLIPKVHNIRKPFNRSF